MSAKISIALISLLSTFLIITYLNYQVSINSPQQLQDLDCGFSSHFQKWLDKSNYSSWGFNRPDIKCPSLGGKSDKSDEIKKIPVIFIHGNSDVGFGRGTTDGYVSWQTGFRALANFLVGKGYTKSQLYTTTWGPANPNAASNNTHNKDNVMRVRKFIEAVIEYTGVKQVNVIGHSMGVTLARKALKGGQATDHSGSTYDVGPSLKDKVKTFVGLAGANYGLVACWTATSIPTCNTKDGFFPGAVSSSGPSVFLKEINTNSGAEASKVYSIWSKNDDLIMYGCEVFGKITCRIPGQTAQVEKSGLDWGHFAVRDRTGQDLYSWL